MYRMPPLGEVDGIEREYLDHGAPSLGRALDALALRWRAGARDEATAVRLLFLLWYSIVEPPYLTGIEAQDDTSARPTFEEVYVGVGGAAAAPPLVRWAVGRMAQMFPWAIGGTDEEERWRAEAERLLRNVDGGEVRLDVSREDLAGLGAAGDYFQQAFLYQRAEAN